MSLQVYNAVEGQSLYDVCLQTYQSLDYLRRLMNDSGVDNINHIPFSGQAFLFDPELVVDQAVQRTQVVTNTKYATAYNKLGNTWFVIIDNGVIPAPSNPYNPQPNPNSVTYTKEETKGDNYTALADGEVSIGLPAWIGWDILQLEREIKPLKPTEYSWNAISGNLTLDASVALEAGMTIFLLFTRTVTITT